MIIWNRKKLRDYLITTKNGYTIEKRVEITTWFFLLVPVLTITRILGD